MGICISRRKFFEGSKNIFFGGGGVFQFFTFLEINLSDYQFCLFFLHFVG